MKTAAKSMWLTHSFVPSGTEAFIARAKVCYDSFQRSYYYKVKIPSLDYPTENSWVKAEYVTMP